MNIALVGPRMSGKSTAAEALINVGYTRLSLADPVKDAAFFATKYIIDVITSSPRPNFDRVAFIRDKSTFRPLLEWIGSTFGRDYLQTPDRWINMFRDRAQRTPGPIVCDDVRFPNEAEALREMGFLIVRVERPHAAWIDSLYEAGENPHDAMESEKFLSGVRCDVGLYNNGTVDDLHRRVLLLARKEAA